jgi:hypothetical protein
LKFEFQTDVTYSLVFREFCLAILYINIGVVCYIYRISFSFIQLSLDLNSDYFMVCFLEKVVKHKHKAKRKTKSQFELTMYATFHLLEFR